MAVIGFDDTSIAGCTDPPLSSVRQPEREAGRTAWEWLISRIEERVEGSETRLLPASLVIRQSCGLHGTGNKETLLSLE